MRRCKRYRPASFAMVLVAAILMVEACGSHNGIELIPDRAYHRARHAYEEGRWDWARVYFSEDLQDHPDRLQSIRDLGISWISGHGGGLSHGIPFFERYLAGRPDDHLVRRRMVGTLIRLGEIEQGLVWAEGLDDHADSHYLWAHLLAQTDSGAALDHLKRAAAIDPGNARVHALAAKIYEEAGEFEQALASCSLGTELDPFDSKNRARYGRLLRKVGHETEADSELRALEIADRLNQSQDASQLNPVEELHLLRELETLGAAAGFAFDRRLTMVLLRSGRIEEGNGLFEQIQSDSLFSLEDRLIFARIFAELGERRRARDLYQSVVDLEPANVTAVSSVALLDIGFGQKLEAREMLEKALALTPFVATYHAVLAQAQLACGEDDLAVTSFDMALELAPWDQKWRGLYAKYWRSRGDHDRSEAVLDDAPDFAGPALPVHSGRNSGDQENSKNFQKPGPQDVSIEGEGEGGPSEWVDISTESGLDFEQYDGRSGRHFYIETTGSGCGFFDFDDDGDLDVYLMTGAPTPGSAPVETPRNVLFENRDGRFVDVTERAGVGDTGFSMGMCVGDVDGDGLLDMMVANYGPDRLYRNLGGGKFEEIADRAGVNESRWSSNCVFGDIDSDGDLDLYVSHYLEAGFENNPFCGDRARNISAYCRPSVFPGVSDSLFINSGDGIFSQEGAQRGLAQGVLEKGFGVVMTDLDDDGDLDIFVANDSTPNRLYVNDGQGFFTESGLVSGVGLNDQGMSTSGMGVDIGDIDGDLKQDLVLTNFAMESNGLYRNLGDLVFEDISRSTGMAASSTSQVGWGARLADFDNDGDLDLAIANGHVVDNIGVFEPGSTYGQRNKLLLNDGSGVFEDVSGAAGGPWREAKVSRALTVGDWNNDGRLDLLIANANDRFDLLENRVSNSNHWLGLKLVGKEKNLAAIGARVVATVGDRTMMREVRSGTGFQSQGDLRLHFGLGEFQGSVSLDIVWPDGSRQNEIVDGFDRYLVVKKRP